jgi:hypothetical protein
MSIRSLPVPGIGLGPQEYLGHQGFAPLDCDRDGNVDLLAFGPNDQERSVEVLHGSGDGTFVPGEHYPMDTPSSLGRLVRGADLNRDQIPDLIILAPYTAVSDRIIVRLGQGDCTFGSEIVLGVGAEIFSIAFEDVDGDEIPDLVTSASEQISTFHGNGDGSFSNRQDFSVGGSRMHVAVTDWNRDGIADVVASDGYLHLLLGTGNGHFDPAIDCALNTSVWSGSGEPLVFADFDGDGVVDLAGGGTILFGMKECAFTRRFTYTQGLYFVPLAAGDFNGDGILDLLVLMDTELGLVPGDGRGSFGALVGLGDFTGGDAIIWPGTGVHVGDFNGDGRLDVIATTGMTVKTVINTCQ